MDENVHLTQWGYQTGLLATLYKTPGVVRAYGLDSGGPNPPDASYTANLLLGLEGAMELHSGLVPIPRSLGIVRTGSPSGAAIIRPPIRKFKP